MLVCCWSLPLLIGIKFILFSLGSWNKVQERNFRPVTSLVFAISLISWIQNGMEIHFCSFYLIDCFTKLLIQYPCFEKVLWTSKYLSLSVATGLKTGPLTSCVVGLLTHVAFGRTVRLHVSEHCTICTWLHVFGWAKLILNQTQVTFLGDFGPLKECMFCWK